MKKNKLDPWVNHLNLLCSVLACGFSFAFAEFDFALGVLCGCLIAWLNFFVLKRVFGKMFDGENPKSAWILIYVFKLALTFGMIYLSLIVFGAEVFGLLAGLSVLFVSILLFALLKTVK